MAPEFTVLHDQGNEENAFDRFDFKPSKADTINLNFQFTRSWFQTPNSFDAQNATAWSGPVCQNYLSYSDTCNGLGPNGQVVGPQDQRSKIRTYNIAPSYTHVMGANAVLTVRRIRPPGSIQLLPERGSFLRFDTLSSDPDRRPKPPADQSRRASQRVLRQGHPQHQNRRQLLNTILTEKDSIGIIDPTANAVCLNADGSNDLNPLLTNPNNCTGALQQNPNFNPLLACYDLSRTGPLPASDGCPSTRSGNYLYDGHADIREIALYIQDTINVHNWTFNLGLRGDIYKGIASENQVEPRLGISYNVKPTNTVLRVSYARTMETPFNENLVLSSLGCNDAVINAIMSAFGPCNTCRSRPAGATNFTPAFRRRLAASSLLMPNTSGNTHIGPTISVFLGTRRSPSRWNGTIRRFPDTPSAAPCPISMASPRML